jgi:pimeloyl-ACP methyl ester carboxylesterase
MPYFKNDSISFYYTQTGSGIPFVFQHGLGGSVDQIIQTYHPPPGVELITFDFRGHGKTPIGREDQINFTTFADDLNALLHHLHVDKAIIGGISMGAAVALNFTLRYPNCALALILSRPAWLDGPMAIQYRAIYKFISELIHKNGPELSRKIFMSSAQYIRLSEVSSTTAQSLLKLFDYEHLSETAIKFERIPEDTPSHDRNEWKGISMPTLILVNKSDPIHPFEYGFEYASQISHADVREIAAKSMSEEQHHRDVQKYIDSFINKLLKGTRQP